MLHIFDGAMGTMLQAAGLKPGAAPELMNVEQPEAVRRIHEAYIEAGADFIETNTFGASPLKLLHYGLEKRVEELNEAAVKIALLAAKGKAKVAGSMGPTGRFVAPLGDLDFDEAYENFYKQAKALYEGGADAIIIETCIDIQEMRAALLAAKDATKIPVICQLSYSEDGRTVTGTDPQSAAVVLDAMGADVIGINCSLGPKELVPLVKILSETTTKPISVQPNAGMPFLENGKTCFPMSPDDFGKYGMELAKAGATYLGGCCGTTPAHIRALSETLKGFVPKAEKDMERRLALASRTKTVVIDKGLPVRLIGERINPTGRKQMAAEILSGSLLSVKKEAINQVKSGADILDVNMGAPGADEASVMERAVKEIARITDAPLVIDTGNPKALEAGLKAFPGRALVNSVTAEKKRIEEFLPIAKRYGAALLLLPITDEGVPKDAKGRIDVAKKIIQSAQAHGFTRGDFILDALVMTASTDENAGCEVIRTLKVYTEEMKLPTTMGLSNISFGLPNRPLINSTFFAMCLAAGLTAPIMNPYDESMQKALMAANVLLGNDPKGIFYSKNAGNLAMPQSAAKPKVMDLPVLAAIKQAVVEGEKEGIGDLIKKAVEEGKDPNIITEEALTAAMTDIGEDFGAGRMFLPQVLLSAETMRVAFDKLRELMPAAAEAKKGKVILATVKGDVHDLGKNITGALLANSGFQTIDLGKDVDREEIVRAAIRENADIVGLCALMTTTMTEIDKVVEALKKAGAKAKVMVGGAALTAEYANSAGADAYAKDAVEAVKIAENFVGS